MPGTASEPRLGFIGVGAMGAPMAASLLDRFGRITVYDVVADLHMPLLIPNMVKQIFEAADAAGWRDDYNPIVVKIFERLANVEWPAAG